MDLILPGSQTERDIQAQLIARQPLVEPKIEPIKVLPARQPLPTYEQMVRQQILQRGYI